VRRTWPLWSARARSPAWYSATSKGERRLPPRPNPDLDAVEGAGTVLAIWRAVSKPDGSAARRGRHAAPRARRGLDTPPRGAGAPPRPVTPRRRRRHRRTGERILRVAVVLVALTLVGTSSVYGYLRFRLNEIPKINCKNCTAVADGTPYNVLIVGSDSRVGKHRWAAQAFGSASLVGGQRSDTIKILHGRSHQRAPPGFCPSRVTPTCRCPVCRRAPDWHRQQDQCRLQLWA